MPEPLLLTKLYIPPSRPGIVPRPRLVERLNEGLHRKLVLVSAPAGFGKTTLVSEWVAVCERPVTWLSLDEGDNDPTRFLTYFIAALQKIVANIGAGTLAVLQSPQPPSIESILTTLLNEITTIQDNFILVLDDYHAIDSEPIDQALTFLLEHLPPQMHLVITTREDPSLPLARLRARGQLTELRAADLRFTPAEAAEFLNQVMGLNLSAEDITALETRTEGWIAGLQLAAIALRSPLSMQGRSDTAGFIQAFTGSHRFVLDYLVEEVLQRQSELIRSFLLQTAILDKFCAPLCNAVTEREDGKEMLDMLERSNLFLIPLDDKRKWYRYHHLFADVLQTHLMEAQLDRAATLHLRASAWYERNGLRSDAIHHALVGKDFERAAGLIELAWPADEGTIQITTWLGWVKTLPDELVRARPVLNVWYAYAFLGRGELEAAEARFKDAERWLEPADTMKVQLETPSVETCPESSRRMVVVDKEQFKSLPAAIAVGRAYIAQALGNISDTVRYASRVLELVPEGDHLRHGQASMLLGITHWASGNLEAANQVFADYTMKLRSAGNIPDAISTTVVLADIRLALGRLHEAINTIEQLLQFVMDQGEPISLDTVDLHRELSELYLEQGNLDAAAQQLQRSKELGEKAELPVWRYRWCTAQARLNGSQGDLDGALALLDEAERLFIRTPLPDVRPISALKARIWVAQGRLTKALEWVRELGLSVDDELSYLREFEHITLARVLIARYKSDRVDDFIRKAVELLDRILKAAEEGGRTGSMIEILVLQALAHKAQANILPALMSLERALALAEPEGYVRIFVDEGKPMAELLTRIEAQDGILRVKEYVVKLLSAFNMREEIYPSGSIPMGKNRSFPHARQAVGPQPLIEPLSERELEVLRLLRTDLNGPEIARELVVSLSTVRTHTQNIYAKLGVNNRRAAVRRAEELDLL
ncbi:MAG: helix-turn-helix transcriptional regulator [Chloroflexi bacterium]|nr:MAG: helix-turn-helix transcriptional regulator [Chloroflexota bacterium]